MFRPERIIITINAFSFAEPGMRVGREFQAIIPDLVSESMLQLLYVYVVFFNYNYD